MSKVVYKDIDAVYNGIVLLINKESIMKVDALVGEYISIRDNLTNVRQEFKAKEDAAKEAMAQLEAQILEISNATGVESFKTAFGTAFRTSKDYARIAPGAREELDEWVLKTGKTQVFTSHLSKVAIKELMETDGLNPAEAGIEYVIEDVIQVRKPTKK